MPAPDTTTLHGVFMRVHGVGLLLCGRAASGKGDLALELLERGHSLIADDAPRFSRAGSQILGHCPALLKGYLHVRDLGVLDIHALFGDTALRDSATLDLVIQLKAPQPSAGNNTDTLLGGSHGAYRLLGLTLPEISLTTTPGRPLVTLVETAARDWQLRQAGHCATEQLVSAQTAALASRVQTCA